MARRYLAALLCVSAVCGAVAGAAPTQSSTPDDPLAAARQWLGGERRLNAIRGIETARADEVKRVALPDRYQIRVIAPFGTSTITFSNDRFESVRPAGMGAPATNEAPEVLAERGRKQVARYALTYLLRTVATYPLKSRPFAGDRCGQIEGRCVEFYGPNGPVFQLVFDRASSRPLAVVTLGTAPATAAPPIWDSIDRLDDYRDVDGVRLPFKLTLERIDRRTGGKEVLSTMAFEDVAVHTEVPATWFGARAIARP